jgi:hypothetical protein
MVERKGGLYLAVVHIITVIMCYTAIININDSK